MKILHVKPDSVKGGMTKDYKTQGKDLKLCQQQLSCKTMLRKIHGILPSTLKDIVCTKLTFCLEHYVSTESVISMYASTMSILVALRRVSRDGALSWLLFICIKGPGYFMQIREAVDLDSRQIPHLHICIISCMKCFQKHISVKYFLKIR